MSKVYHKPLLLATLTRCLSAQITLFTFSQNISKNAHFFLKVIEKLSKKLFLIFFKKTLAFFLKLLYNTYRCEKQTKNNAK